MFQQYQNTFNKVNLDFDDRNMTFHDFHPHLGVILAVNGIFLNNKDSKLRFLWPSVSISMGMLGSGLMMTSTIYFYTVNEMGTALEAFAYFIIMFMVLILYQAVIFGVKSFYKIVNVMVKDFQFISTADEKFRKQFFDGQLIIWKFFMLWSFFLFLVGFFYSSYNVVELTHQQLFTVLDEFTQRPLIFPIWLPKDQIYRTPTYEIFLIIQYICIAVVISSFGAYIYLMCHFLQHILVQLDMVILAIDCLLVGIVPDQDGKLDSSRDILGSRLKVIVDQHITAYNFADYVQDIYGAVLGYQVLFSSIFICLMMYQVADDLDHGKINFIFGLMLTGSFLQLWIPCYLGSRLEEKALAVGDACFFCGWHNMNITGTLDRGLQILIIRANRPLQLRAQGLSYLSLETFNSIVSSAYSYFNMLRQANAGTEIY